MKVTLNVLENNGHGADKRWPNHILGGRIRTSTLVLIIAFCAAWWTYDTYRPAPTPPVAPQVVPPGFVPDPSYTWVPRTRVQPPTYETPTHTPTPTPTPTTTPPTTTSPTTTPPPPFGPGTTTPAQPGPAPAPAPGLPGLPVLPR